jgi:hypothetical protein
MHIFSKVMRHTAAQRDETQRAEYWWAILEECTDPAQLLFADETAKVDSVLRRKRGWGGKGTRVEAIKLLHRSTHISVLATYDIEGFVGFDCKEGAYGAADFMEAVEETIICHLNPFPGPRSILVLDNCRIHHTYERELRDMVESKGAKLLFLAPYSPIDNPIESAFNVFKMYWVRHAEFLCGLPVDQAIDICLKYCYGDAALAARRSFESCGYNF